MKFTVQKHLLSDALQQVSTAVATQTTIPILTGIKITVEDDRCILTASNSDISIQVQLMANEEETNESPRKLTIVEQGDVVLPARFFVDIIRKLPDEPIEITVDNKFTATIRSSNGQFQLNGLDATEFPRLPYLVEEQTFSISNRLLKDMIRQTAFAVSTTETRPVLTGVLWQLEDNTLCFTATDSHRLAKREATVETKQDLTLDQVVVPGKNLIALNKLLKDDDTLADIVISDNQLLVKNENILFYSRLLEGKYPDTSRIIPQQSEIEILLNAKELLHSVDRASLLSRDIKNNVVKLVAEGNTVEISANSPQVGQLTETVPVEEISGGTLKISFNAKFILDVLRVLDSEKVRLLFTGPMTPFVVRPAEHDRCLYLILPVRTY